MTEEFGLSVDGIVGSETKKQLESFSLSDIQRKLSDLGYDCDALGVRDTKAVAAIQSFQGIFSIDRNGVINLTTKQKLDARSLLDIQKKLKQRGYVVDITGKRDAQTVKAIKEFQQASVFLRMELSMRKHK